MWTAALLGLCLAAQDAPGAGTRTETWPDGAKKAEYGVALDELGVEQRHGPYRAFRADGTLEAEGAFARGAEDGAWTLYHPNGAKAAAGLYAGGLRSGTWESWFPDGRPESKGAYVRGAMDGRWSYWRADGSKDLVASGVYRLEVYRSREDGRHYRGYFVDNKRQGTWTSHWPDKSVQLEGRFEAGVRVGPWIFHHLDGTPSALILSGEYAGGEWRAALALAEPPPYERARFPAPEPSPRGWPGERTELSNELRATVAARALPRELAVRLAAAGVPALPIALELLRELDPESDADRAALGFLEEEVLRRLAAGHALSRFGKAGPPDAPAARELVRAWLSLWAATRTDVEFWESALAGPSRASGLRDPLQDPPLLERDPRYDPSARLAEPALAAEDGVRSEYRLRFGKAKEEALRLAPAGAKESIARALRWLAAHQRSDGSWSSAEFSRECGKLGKDTCAGPGKPTYDVGLTGLALLCLLGDGNSPAQGPHREAVARGLDWLVQNQNDEGLIGSRELHDFAYGHAIATAALCEGVGLGAEALRAPAEAALAFLELARHPQGGWRYAVPPTELGDSSVTGWAVGALVAGRHAGLAVPDQAFTGALACIDRLSDVLSGRVGYVEKTDLSARTPENEAFPREMGEALTAVGLYVRLQLGQRPEGTPIVAAHAKRVAAKPPVIDPDLGGDQYYWYYATCALHELGAPYWDAWEVEFRRAVLARQSKRGDAEGSWDPIGPWGASMGRVGATTLMTLALQSFYRYPPLLGAR
jgi:antitoxin component YwqK of YwqJK toxin-antitoxin module